MRFFLGFIGFLVLMFLLWGLVVAGQAGRASKMSQWVYDAYEKKSEIALRIKEKKIVIVAGSNALFGIDSKLLGDEFGMRVLNYGVNAGVELPVTLHVARRVINAGDVVIVPLEYPMYSYDGEAGVQMIDYVFSREAAFFWELSLKEQFYMLWHVDAMRVWSGYFDRSKKRVESGLYGAHHIDENGDQIDTGVEFRSEGMLQEVEDAAKKPQKYGAEFDRDALGWRYLEGFVEWCMDRDVKVIFMPPTLLRDESYFSDKLERVFYESLAGEVRERGWVFVGEPYVYMYDKSYYFNTNFHLIDEGREMRTKQMISDLGGEGWGLGGEW